MTERSIDTNAIAKERADVIVAAYTEHGLMTDEQRDALTPSIVSDIAELFVTTPTGSFEPYVPVSKLASVSLKELIALDDPGLKDIEGGWHNPKGTFVFSRLWEQYKLDQLTPVSRSESLVRGLVLGGRYRDGLFDDDGSGVASIPAHEKDVRFDVQFLDPSAFILLSMIRRVEGKPSLRGFNIFPGFSPKDVRVTNPAKVFRDVSHLHTPYATTSSTGLVLGMTDLESFAENLVQNPDRGIRYSVALVPPFDSASKE